MGKKKQAADPLTSEGDAPTESTFRQSVAKAIEGMIYISESEAPLDLEDWPDVSDLTSLQAKISTQFGAASDAQTQVSPDDFLAGIQQMADPSDPVMVEYAGRYSNLFALLKPAGGDVVVIRALARQLHIFIAVFSEGGTVVIHTTAVET